MASGSVVECPGANKEEYNACQSCQLTDVHQYDIQHSHIIIQCSLTWVVVVLAREQNRFSHLSLTVPSVLPPGPLSYRWGINFLVVFIFCVLGSVLVTDTS